MMYEQPSSESQTARLEDYLQAIRGHRLLIVLFALAFLSIGWWYNGSRVEIYESETAVALGPTPVGAVNANLLAPSVERESEILASLPVAQGVIASLGLTDSPAALLEDLEVQFVPRSDVLTATYRGTDAEQVSMIANGFVAEYSTQREAAAVAFYETDIEVLEEQVDTIEDDTDQLKSDIETATAARSTEVARPASEDRTANIAVLDGELSTLRADLNNTLVVQRSLQGQLDTARRALLTRQTTAEVIRLSEPSSSPAGLPGSFLLAGLGLLGLILGIATAFLLDRLDRTARDVKALNLALGSNVVGEIPSFGFANRGGSSSLIMLTQGGSTRVQRTKESIRRLRSAVQFLVPSVGKEGSMVIALSSAYPGEGKSTTTSNLAIALAQAGSDVILISGDLRRPTVEVMFDVSRTPGLSDLLGGTADRISLVESGVDNLLIVPSGAASQNPSELLGSGMFETAIKELREQADFVLIDTPPILATADALVIGPRVDGMLIVVDSRTTDTDDLLQVRAELERSGTNLLGSVLNRDKSQRGTMLKRNRYAYAKVADE